MLTQKRKISWDPTPTLNKDLSTTDECWERERIASSRDVPLIGYPIQTSHPWNYISTKNKTVLGIYIYIFVHTYTYIYNDLNIYIFNNTYIQIYMHDQIKEAIHLRKELEGGDLGDGCRKVMNL